MDKKPALTGKKQANQFKKGQSGNPAGRPRGSVSLTSAICRVLKETDPVTEKKYLDLLALSVINAAIAGRGVNSLWARIDGPIPDPVEETETDGSTLENIIHCLTVINSEGLWNDTQDPEDIMEIIE